MSYKHFTEAADSTAKFKNGMERYIYLEACYRADRRGVVRMSQSELASIALVSPRTIALAFSALEKGHLLIRVGHGRYEITSPTQSPEAATLIDQVRQWLNKRDEESIEIGSFNVTDREQSALPPFFTEAIEKGLIKIAEKGRYISGPGQTEAFTTYTIHF